MSDGNPDPCEALGAVMTCRDCVAFLLDYLEQTLPEEQRLVFESHLAFCPDCRTYLDNYRRTLDATRQLAQEEPAAGVPKRLITAILAARKYSHE